MGIHVIADALGGKPENTRKFPTDEVMELFDAISLAGILEIEKRTVKRGSFSGDSAR